MCVDDVGLQGWLEFPVRFLVACGACLVASAYSSSRRNPHEEVLHDIHVLLYLMNIHISPGNRRSFTERAEINIIRPSTPAAAPISSTAAFLRTCTGLISAFFFSQK